MLIFLILCQTWGGAVKSQSPANYSTKAFKDRIEFKTANTVRHAS